MSKLKLLYDVVKTLKDKEAIKGTLQAKAEKNQVQIFSLNNEFAHNLESGETRARVSTQVDYEGKKVKHESSTEFNTGSHRRPKFPGFHGHLRHHGDCHQPDCLKPHGFKAKLSRLVWMLNILNQVKITELADKSLLLSFNTSELPEDMQQVFREHMERHHSCEEHSGHHPRFMQELGRITATSAEVSLQINQKREVEKAEIIVNGQCADAPEETKLHFKGELNLEW